MRHLKYVVSMLGLSAALLFGGCGAADSGNGGAASAESEEISAEAEENTAAQEDASGDDAKTDETADGTDSQDTEAKEEKDSRDLTGADAEGYVQDASYALRSSAAAGSLEEISGRYTLEDAAGVYYYFDGNGSCYYVQKGTYFFTHDASMDGTDADMICMEFDTQESPTNYIIEQGESGLQIRTTYSGAESETIVPMELVSGTDGIGAMEPFEGIYRVYSMDGYRYEFHADGSFYMILDETYSVADQTLTLSAFDQSLTYDYAAEDGKIVLSSEDTTVATLVPTELN